MILLKVRKLIFCFLRRQEIILLDLIITLTLIYFIEKCRCESSESRFKLKINNPSNSKNNLRTQIHGSSENHKRIVSFQKENPAVWKLPMSKHLEEQKSWRERQISNFRRLEVVFQFSTNAQHKLSERKQNTNDFDCITTRAWAVQRLTTRHDWNKTEFFQMFRQSYWYRASKTKNSNSFEESEKK